MSARHLFGLLGIGVAFAVGAGAVERGKPAPPVAAPTANVVRNTSGPIVRLQISGGINPATADYIRDGLRKSRDRDARAMLIELDTPGGLIESAKTIVKDLLGAEVPVIVFVSPAGAGATSAGVLVTLAAHVAAMAPGTNIGAAHPVGPQGESIEGDMGDKVENFVASLSRTIAERRGRNAEWAEKAVRESVSITDREALRLKVIDLVANDVPDLLQKIDGRQIEIGGRSVTLATAGAVIEPQEMRLGQRLLDILANPNVAYLLLMAGILGLYVEFTHPGAIVPGIAGAICLLMAFAALQVLPINYTGLALIALGVLLLVAELFLPSFGVVGVGGLVAFVLGSLLLFETPESTIAVDRRMIFAAAATLGTFTLVVALLVVRTQRRPAVGGAEGMIGEIGEVRRLDTSGRVKVFVHGEYWDAVADGPVDVGAPVEVVSVDGLHMRVRPHHAGARTTG